MNVYIHIPFCRSKCAYCAFVSNANLEPKPKYLEALKEEIKLRSNKLRNNKAETIYIGGGTPSLLEIHELGQILDIVNGSFKKPWKQEVTLEVNPEDITEEKLQAWMKLKINRLSIGVQTLNDEVRKTIGRNMTGEEVISKLKLAINYFSNMNVDLIAGLPGDDIESFQEGIKKIYKRGINHISLYDLELDNTCRIALNPKDFKLLNENQREDFLTNSWETLDFLGYKQYEISNFSYDNKPSRHNWDFWLGKDYIGFGLGAASRIDNKVITNTTEMKKYMLKEFVAEVDNLSEADATRLNLMLALRTNHKVKEKLEAYEKAAGLNLNKKLSELTQAGLIDKKINLTQKGRLFYNQVTSTLLT